jgi:hypothetical protein
MGGVRDRKGELEPMIGFGPIVGYTTRQHLLLDLDNTNERKAIKLQGFIQRSWPEVGTALLVQTRADRTEVDIGYKHLPHPVPVILVYHGSYHLVFDNFIGYKRATDIILALVNLNILPQAYADIRKFRGDMTLRISKKVGKDDIAMVPRPVCYLAYGLKLRSRPRHLHGIALYLRALRTFRKLSRNFNVSPAHSAHRNKKLVACSSVSVG